MNILKFILVHNRLPFDVKIPNQITISAMNDTEKEIGETFDSVDELFKDLND